jgi:hypothetical protein
MAYSAWDGSDLEIYLYDLDARTRTQITDNERDDFQPILKGSNIVWSFDDGNDLEIAFWSDLTATQVADNLSDDLGSSPKAHLEYFLSDEVLAREREGGRRNSIREN